MLRTIAFLLLIAGGAVFAQQPDAKTRPSPEATAATAPAGSKELAAKVKASFYHPDALPGLACTVTVDWSKMLSSMSTQVPDERIKALNALRIKVKALRNQQPDVTFSWENSAPPEGAEQMLSGMKRMIEGHFQTYWSILASSNTAEMVTEGKVTPQPDGGASVETSTGSIKVNMTVDKNGLPTRYAVEMGTTTATMEPHYANSPQPRPGDMRRVSELDVTQEIGANKMVVQENIDYQPVESYFVPQHLRVTVGGALTIPLEFSDCSVIEPEK